MRGSGLLTVTQRFIVVIPGFAPESVKRKTEQVSFASNVRSTFEGLADGGKLTFK